MLSQKKVDYNIEEGLQILILTTLYRVNNIHLINAVWVATACSLRWGETGEVFIHGRSCTYVCARVWASSRSCYACSVALWFAILWWLSWQMETFCCFNWACRLLWNKRGMDHMDLRPLISYLVRMVYLSDCLPQLTPTFLGKGAMSLPFVCEQWNCVSPAFSGFPERQITLRLLMTQRNSPKLRCPT